MIKVYRIWDGTQNKYYACLVLVPELKFVGDSPAFAVYALCRALGLLAEYVETY